MTKDNEYYLSIIFSINNEFVPLVDDDEATVFEKENVPEELPILPLRDMVLLPGMVLPITVGRPKSLNLIRTVNKESRILGVVTQKDVHQDEPAYEDLYKVGTIAHILKILEMPNDEFTVLLQGRQNGWRAHRPRWWP